ncbi:hypothetical protein BV25DRAFT_1533903 [Artomyces pyxidatus]|uniref:Uncharacterized protein n=1 Tax=Artomyces pyxidatus TaxID=48021 RepID=A0ACB8SLB2_9AGAM|nr:hypothetical protein BV25DRAFT_1533903 [Artomyces pyxidatus]
MDATQLSRWTRFAAKGGIGKCTALQDCVAKEAEDLMFLKDDEIVVLMQLADQEDAYLGYCEGVVGRFQGAYVHFQSKLKTPVMTKRSSSASKSPRSSLGQRYAATQSPVPSLARAASREDTVSLRALVTSPTPSIPTRLSSIAPPPIVPPPVVAPSAPESADTSLIAETSVGSVEAAAQDSLLAPSTSYSSASSVQDSASPKTPSDFRLEQPMKLEEPVEEHTLDDTMGIQQDETVHRPLSFVAPTSPSGTDASLPLHDDSASVRMSRISAAMSDGVAGIGLSLLQDFISGGGDDDDDDDDVRSFTSRSDSDAPASRHSVHSTVEFPIPPRRIPVVEPATTAPHSPTSTHHASEDEWEGASDIYDNYRYSRFSMSSKMSKSSAHTGSQVPPPVPRPSFDRAYSSDAASRRSMDSHVSSQAPLSPPLPAVSAPEPAQSSSTDPAVKLAQPPTLLLDVRNKMRPSPLELASPLLHTNFGSPMSSPGLNSSLTATHSPSTPSFARAASALREKLEVLRDPSPPQSATPTNAQSEPEARQIVVEDDEEVDAPVQLAREEDAQSESSVEESTIATTSRLSSDKKRGLPSPLIVVNQAPPPPYTPMSPPSLPPQAGPAPVSPVSPLFNAMPAPVIPPARPRPQKTPDAAQQARESMFGSARTSMFLPHPNAPKPTPTSMGPMYGRFMQQPSQQPEALPTGSLIHTLRMASATRYGPNGRPRLTTIYGVTERQLAESLGPVPISFSLDPPNDIPANRMQKRPATAEGTATGKELKVVPDSRPPSTQNVIPRANFFPRAAGARPRSRSFSGFDSQLELTLPKEKSREEPALKSSASDTSLRISKVPGRPSSQSARLAPQQRQYTPSPLALSQTTAPSPLSSASLAANPAPITPTSPRSFTAPTSPNNATSFSPVKSPAQSEFKIGSPQQREQHLSAGPSPKETGSIRRNPSLPSSPVSPPPDPRAFTTLNREITTRASRSSLKRRTSVDTDVSNQSEARSAMASPPPSGGLGRNTSLRSKLSLSALRAKGSTQNMREEKPREGETVQVEDLDFELVRPTLPAARSSEDSSIFARSSFGGDGKLERPNFLRAESPASPVPRSPASVSDQSLPAGKNSAVEAHRSRELKWISLMASTPSAQARKSKKIRKLLQEGVPASVRYQVWAHLTDSKAKRIEGLYSQLAKREKVPAFADIERDARQCFSTDPRLSEVGGPLVCLLQAYLTMVPDIQYDRGLVFIAGQLLLQSPEEDAFWIFISLMDTYLRPYFSSNAIQLDVDASLFAKSLEAIDPSISKKLFVDMGMKPIRLCRPWFGSLFVEALPPDYFQRVWDLFLSEGVVFLFRVGLALVTLCRRTLLDAKNEDQALHLLTRPPAILLSSTPDTLVELANSMKLKDDDIRKQRVKMEAQLKRQTQSRIPPAQAPSISLPRS